MLTHRSSQQARFGLTAAQAELGGVYWVRSSPVRGQGAKKKMSPYVCIHASNEQSLLKSPTGATLTLTRTDSSNVFIASRSEWNKSIRELQRQATSQTETKTAHPAKGQSIFVRLKQVFNQ